MEKPHKSQVHQVQFCYIYDSLYALCSKLSKRCPFLLLALVFLLRFQTTSACFGTAATGLPGGGGTGLKCCAFLSKILLSSRLLSAPYPNSHQQHAVCWRRHDVHLRQQHLSDHGFGNMLVSYPHFSYYSWKYIQQICIHNPLHTDSQIRRSIWMRPLWPIPTTFSPSAQWPQVFRGFATWTTNGIWATRHWSSKL
jgi:hypothetical protein